MSNVIQFTTAERELLNQDRRDDIETRAITLAVWEKIKLDASRKETAAHWAGKTTPQAFNPDF